MTGKAMRAMTTTDVRKRRNPIPLPPVVLYPLTEFNDFTRELVAHYRPRSRVPTAVRIGEVEVAATNPAALNPYQKLTGSDLRHLNLTDFQRQPGSFEHCGFHLHTPDPVPIRLLPNFDY